MGEGAAAVAGAGAKNGGWTVILRRHNTSWGLTNFNRSHNTRLSSVPFTYPGQYALVPFMSASDHKCTSELIPVLKIIVKNLEIMQILIDICLLFIEAKGMKYYIEVRRENLHYEFSLT